MKKLVLAALLLGIFTGTQAIAQNSKKTNPKLDLSMYPAPKAGYKQVYIQLPSKKNEDNFKVEIYAGKNTLVDCNKYFMTGTITEETVKGWGYNYYNVNSTGDIAGTRMACPNNKKTSQFIHIQPQIIRYNSKLPIVLNVPIGFEVKYKVWTKGNTFKNAQTNTLQNTVEKSTSVENKKWQLVTLFGKPVKGNADTHYMIFNSNTGLINAKAGCNLFSFSYTIKNEFQLNVKPGMSTMMACPDATEEEFKKMLSTVDNITTDGETLSLNKARMAPLATFKLVK